MIDVWSCRIINSCAFALHKEQHLPQHWTSGTMATAQPRVTIAKPNRANGVLSIPASATQKKGSQSQDMQSSRSNMARLKLIIRRLPPGLTQHELEEALGDEWKVGAGRVDWLVYKCGKLSKEYEQQPWGRWNLLNDAKIPYAAPPNHQDLVAPICIW